MRIGKGTWKSRFKKDAWYTSATNGQRQVSLNGSPWPLEVQVLSCTFNVGFELISVSAVALRCDFRDLQY